MSHSDALETTIDALDVQPIDAALIEVCRVVARHMDAAGDAPPTRLAAIYLSALRNLRKIDAKPASGGGKLAKFRTVN